MDSGRTEAGLRQSKAELRQSTAELPRSSTHEELTSHNHTRIPQAFWVWTEMLFQMGDWTLGAFLSSKIVVIKKNIFSFYIFNWFNKIVVSTIGFFFFNFFLKSVSVWFIKIQSLLVTGKLLYFHLHHI